MRVTKRIAAMVLIMLMLINIMPVKANAKVDFTEQELIEMGMNSAIAPLNSGNSCDVLGGVATFSLRTIAENADVLVIKNKHPWDSAANEILLSDLNINYKVITIEESRNMDFSSYRLIIVANDQVDSFYRSLSEIRTKLELFVMNGGTLLYGICDAGWGGGYSDLLIPGDIQLGPVAYEYNNYIVDNSHPVVTGVLTDEAELTNSHLYNNYASHRYFQMSSLPIDTNIVLNAGDDKPTLIEYPIGNGIVIASALTWEHSYSQGDSRFGKMAFDDLLLYAYTVSRIVTDLNKNPDLGYDSLVKGLTCTAGDPVNVSNGNFLTGNTDLKYEGNITINFSRFYNSLDNYQGILGKNWRSNYDIYLQKLSDRRIRLWHADGHSEDFIFGDDGVWYATPGTNSKIEIEGSNIVITLADKTEYCFNEAMKLISIKSAYDKRIDLDYNELGQLVLVTQGDFWYEYEYAERLLISVSDKAGRAVNFSYNNGNLSCVENYEKECIRYEYDDVGRITKMIVDDEYTIQNIYDDYGRVIEQVMPLEGSCKFIYDDDAYTTTYVDKNGATVVYYKDEYGRIYKKQYVDGIEELEFDSNNYLLKKTDKLGNSTLYQYDDNGNCVAETDAMGNTIKYEYDERNNKTLVIDAEGNQFEYIYDADNYLIAQTDAYGIATVFEYDEKKQLIKICLPNKQEILYEYDMYGNVISVVDSEGYKTQYVYNDLNQLIKEIDANGNSVCYEYSDFGKIKKKVFDDESFTISQFDSKGNLIAYIDELGNEEVYTYNIFGGLTSVKDGAGNLTRYEYDCMNNVSKIIYPDGSYRQYVYDLSNNLVEVVDEEGFTTDYKYDVNGNIVEERDENTNTTYYKYDALNRLIQIKDAKGNITTQNYSPNNNLVSITDASGYSQYYEYNKNGQLTKWINEIGEEEIYEYDEMGYVGAAIDANGNKTSYAYNAKGDINKIIFPNGSEACIGYDGIGNMISYTDPNGVRTEYRYDMKGNLLREEFADGSCVQYRYDVAGNQVSYIDENGNLTQYEYDEAHRLVKVIDAMNNQTLYSYDLRDNLSKMTQYAHVSEAVIKSMAKGKGVAYDDEIREFVTSYEYDRKNQLVKEISPTGKITSYQYDAVGNMISKKDADEIITRYTYDEVDNLISIQYGDEKCVNYQYNATNHVIGMSDWNGDTVYELDPLGRILSVVDYQNRKISYNWNANNQKSYIEYPDGSTVIYQYDCMNQLTQVVDSILGTSSYEYDKCGNTIQINAPNGTKTVNTYDNKSRLIKKTDFDSTNKIVDVYTYVYDKVGNKISVNRDKKLGILEKALDESNGTTTYQYNSLNQLISQTNSNGANEKYFYDSLGNRVRKESWIKGKIFVSVSDYSYNNENQLQEVIGGKEIVYGTLTNQPVSLQYDGRGNLTKVIQRGKEVASFVYDEANSLVESKNLVGLITEYEYDGNGARVSKSTRLPEDLSNLSAYAQKQLEEALESLCETTAFDLNIDDHVTYYYFSDITSDYNDVLLTYGNHCKTVRYTYGMDIIGASVAGKGWNGCEEDKNSIDYDQVNSVYYFMDEQGTPIKLTNQNGKVIGKYSYDEYGELGVNTYVSSVLGSNNVISYAGYQYDVESGLYYVQARYYNPQTGSFVSKDAFHGSIVDVQSLNRYTYCYNNPIRYVDPSGYYTTIEGKAAHLALQSFFMMYYLEKEGEYPYIERPVYGIFANVSGWGRADMVLDRKHVMEVYEIKPYPDINQGFGRVQLEGYVSALDIYSIKPVIKGESFLSVANQLRLPYPLDTTRTITYYTDPMEPGMIYYNISAKKRIESSKVPMVVPSIGKSTSTIGVEGVCGVGGNIENRNVTSNVFESMFLVPSLLPTLLWKFIFGL